MFYRSSRILVATLSVLFTSSVLQPAFSAADSTPTSSISSEARKHFEAGVSFLEDPDGARYEDAYHEFKIAYELSKSPKILGNMGLCAMKLERDGEAIEAYKNYLESGIEIDPDERKQIERDLKAIQISVVKVNIKVSMPGARIYDSRTPIRANPVNNVYGPVQDTTTIGIRPGRHTLKAQMGNAEDSWSFDAEAGATLEHEFTLKKREIQNTTPLVSTKDTKSEKPSMLAPIILTSVGGALLLTGIITGVVALNKTKDIQNRCPNNICPSTFDLETARSSARGFVRATDVLLILGGLATVGGGSWWLISGISSSNDTIMNNTASLNKRKFDVGAACSFNGCIGSFQMKF